MSLTDTAYPFFIFLWVFGLWVFKPLEAVLLSVIFTLIRYEYISSLRKIQLCISVKKNIFKHPDYPQKIARKVLEKLEKIDSGEMKWPTGARWTFHYLLEGSGNSAWSYYDKDLFTITPAGGGDGVSWPKRLFLLSVKLSKEFLPKSDKEPMLVIREIEHCYFECLFVYKKSYFEYDEKKICNFPSSLVYGSIFHRLFEKMDLKRCGFLKEKEIYGWRDGSFTFENDYFRIEVIHHD